MPLTPEQESRLREQTQHGIAFPAALVARIWATLDAVRSEVAVARARLAQRDDADEFLKKWGVQDE